MVILIDTNIIMDYLLTRQPFMDNVDYIVTRNITDFSASPIPAILPEDFLRKMTD